jgi:hypothetical protein
VTCKLFADNSLLENGANIDCVTEYTTAKHFSEMIGKAKDQEMKCSKGPWIFLKFGQFFGWDANTIITMARFIDNGGFKENSANLTQMSDFLQ